MAAWIGILYLIPLIIVAIGTHPWVKKNERLATPLLMLALLPGINILAGVVVIILRIGAVLFPSEKRSS